MKTLKDKKLMVREFVKITNPKNEYIGMLYYADVKEAIKADDENLCLLIENKISIMAYCKRREKIFGDYKK